MFRHKFIATGDANLLSVPDTGHDEKWRQINRNILSTHEPDWNGTGDTNQSEMLNREGIGRSNLQTRINDFRWGLFGIDFSSVAIPFIFPSIGSYDVWYVSG